MKLKEKIVSMATVAALALAPIQLSAGDCCSSNNSCSGDMDVGGGVGYEEACCAPNYSWLGLVGAAVVIAGVAVLIANIDDSGSTGHAHL